MSNNLPELRRISKLTPKELSILLNITVHTYIALEQEKVSFSAEIVVMLAKIYKIPTHYLFEDISINWKEIDRALQQFSECDKKDRFSVALTNLIGQNDGTYVHKKIRKVKSEILREIQ